MPTTSSLSALNLTAPALGDAPIGQPVSVDLGVWAPGANLTADLLRDGVVVQTGLDGSDIVFTPADDEASFVLRVTGAPAGGGPTQEVVSAPVTARYAPPATVPGQVPQAPEIYDENTGPQTLDLGPAFAGEALSFTVTGLTVTSINASTGILSTSTNAPISSGQVTVVAQNSGGSAAITVDIIVEDDGDMILTPTTMQTSVADPLTSHVYSFVAADGVTPEAREVGQYQDGTWFVLGEPGDEVRIGSISPVSVGVSTETYTRPDNLSDQDSTGIRTRFLHGTMVNPWQGQSGREVRPLAFDSYYSDFASGDVIAYDHSLNVDPGAIGGPLVLAEGSVVKGESLPEEGGHTLSASDKTRLLQFSILTVVPEIPAANSFRPSMRGTDKRSYWTTDQLDIAGKRTVNTGDRPYTTTDISNVTQRIKHVQQVFASYQEPARRWNPGARGGGVDIYGNDWYSPFSVGFAAFYGDYTDAELEDLLKATVQVGIDIYGLLDDNGYYYPAQAHHAGRKGVCFMAGFLLNNQDILDKCDFNLNPRSFGVDDQYCGYVSQQMIGVQPRYYKGAYPYKWEQEHLGLAEWSTVFPEDNEDGVATEEQVADSDIARRSYQVLSFDNGALYQALFGMIADPTGQYYNHAYFDFIDRYLAVRVGDRIDGLWDAHDPDNGHFTGNWYSIDPHPDTVVLFQNMRDVSAWPNYLETMIPEALPKPQVSHDGSSAYLDVDFNANNFQSPQNKHAAITGYDLRWTAFAGGADAVTSEDDEAYLGNFDWHVIEDVTMPYQLSGVPRGLKVKVQLRMKNVNGPGPFLDDRKRENYANKSAVFDVTQENSRYSTNFDVPDLAAFDQIPQNFKAPSATPALGAVTGGAATGDDGIWADGTGTVTVERQWQVSDDGQTGWADISGATGLTFVTTAAQENRFIRLGVRKTNGVGTSAYEYANAGLPVAPPVAIELNAGATGISAFDPGAGALGGKRLLVLFATRNGSPIAVGGSVGAYSFGVPQALYQTNSGTSGGQRERQLIYQVEIPQGETAQTITFNHSNDENRVAVYELATAMQVTETDNNISGLTTTVSTVSGGAVFWMGRSDGWVNFASSASLVAHTDNPAPNNDWAYAHALGVSDGAVSVTHTNAAASNTRTVLISVEPAS